MNTGSTGLLRKAGNVVFQVFLHHHHEVSQLVNNDDDVRQLERNRLGVVEIKLILLILAGKSHLVLCLALNLAGHSLNGSIVDGGILFLLRLINGAVVLAVVEVLEVTHAHLTEQAVATLHFIHSPAQRTNHTARLSHHRANEMRQFAVRLHFHHLGIHQNKLQLLRAELIEHGKNHAVDAHGLTGTRGTGHQRMRHGSKVTDNRVAVHILTQRHRNTQLRAVEII